MVCHAAAAADLGGVDGVDVEWDNTLRGTFAFRTEGANGSLLSAINGNDGDRAFAPGPVSQRLDLFSELTLRASDWGFYASGDGWYDPAYQGASANRTAFGFNPVSVGYDQFPAATRALDGGMAELYDAYLSLRDVGGLPLSLRLGRQTQLWGESLFFAGNAIAGAQGPVDQIKALSEPLAETQEILLPVTQADARLALGAQVSLEAYWQFEWRRDRLPGAVSYFSTQDYLDAGGERIFLGGAGGGIPAGGGGTGAGPGPYAGLPILYAPAAPTPPALLRTADRVPAGPGAFGIALRYSGGAFDAGLYALRSDATLPQLYYVWGPSGTASGGRYGLDFPRGIGVFGASVSRSWSSLQLAAEASVRTDAPLVSRFPPLAAPGAPAVFARGTTLHANLSGDLVLSPSRWWNAAELTGEVAANAVASVTRDAAALAPGRTQSAAAARAVFTPTYYEVAPNLDVSVPLGIGIGLAGRSRFDAGMAAGVGDCEVGVSATYRRVWQIEAMFTHFVGGAGQQKLADRDFATISISRTF